MIAGFLVGVFTTLVPVLTITDFGERLMVITLFTAAVWVTVMYLTPPESEATLERFYRKVRPGGPGWRRFHERTGIRPAQSLKLDLLRVAAASIILYGLMFSTGAFLLMRWMWALVLLAVAVLAWFWLHRLHQYARAARSA
jgi:hypothetical protein